MAPKLPAVWTVTLEAAGDLRAAPVDAAIVPRLLDLLGDDALAVDSLPRRYTVRLQVVEEDALEAARVAAGRLAEVVGPAGLPNWPLGRVEVTRAS